MALENNQFDGHSDIAQFLEKFKEQTFSDVNSPESRYPSREESVPAKPAQYDRSFEKLERKILELEERFEASSTQNQLILSELARTREAMERQKDKDAFLEHLSRTIANLKASVENLARAQKDFTYREPDIQRSFDPVAPSFRPNGEDITAVYHYQTGLAHSVRERTSADREEKERIITSLRQKTSQLKAVNSALDREIKKVQQEKMEALKKSAEQAKEILSLRDQLTAAEERFKSFDFENRIISIKQEYQQKVSSLENQLQEISDTCMKQVEEIESLKAENLKLHKAAAEKEEALARLEEKERELLALKNEMAALEEDSSKRAQKQLAVFSERLRTLEGQRDGLAAELEQAQASLEAVRQEKELLEKNFKELVEKINSNDAVIEQLKHKIEVLGRQNEKLTHQNQALFQQNATLQQTNDTLSQEKTQIFSQAAFLAREKDSLDIRSRQLDSEKETLQQEKDALSKESSQLKKRAEELEIETKELAKENQHLRNQSAALLAARLVQEKERAVKEETLRKAAADKPAEKQLRSLEPKPVISQADRTDSLKKTALPNPIPPETDSSKGKQIPLSEKPVEMNASVSSKVKTEEDLPEIRVADPVPQHQQLFDGEDFLEKTDSFIGRIKWSIFREER